MLRLRKHGLMAAGAVLLTFSIVACSRIATVQGTGLQQAAQEGRVQSANTASPSSNSEVLLSQAKQESKLISTAAAHSFSDSDILLGGTLLTVRLEKALSADALEAGGAFDAVVAEPVVIGGVIVIPQGASVAGRVEAARASALKRSRAYVRLNLASIEVGGRDLAVHTSSLFARGRSDVTSMFESASSIGTMSSITLVNSVHLNKGRQLTFRLTGPVSVPGERSVAAR
jgi:hypothetical protein